MNDGYLLLMTTAAIMQLGDKVCASCIRSIAIGPQTTPALGDCNHNGTSDSNSNAVADDNDKLSINSVFALESPGLLGIGGKVWDSTYVLLEYLGARKDTYITGKKIVELGCGTGLTGK
jgi:hypothetical protein